MVYVHESNFNTKITDRNGTYYAKRDVIQEFRDSFYYPTRRELESLTFDENHPASFDRATSIINDYYELIRQFSSKHDIKSQSKFESTFLEEMSVYLFKDLPQIINGQYDFFNKKIYAGLKVNTDNSVDIITKDVDFCIGKKIDISIDGSASKCLILPIVCVEVKTYLDATMFGEVKSSSKAIRSASPQSKAYVLMGYKDLANEHIISARQDSTLNEMFALRRDEHSGIDAQTLYDYWKEITQAVEEATSV